MLYPEYKEASLRHLETVDYMVNNLNSAGAANEDKILKNIYYISGYAIECIVVYAIYNHIAFPKTTDVTALNSFIYPFNVGFYRTCKKPGRPAQKRKPRYNIMSHNFQLNCTFFSQNGIVDANKVPFFDSFIPDARMTPLFNNWKPAVRYINCGFNKDEIIDFAKLAKDIHLKTRQNITKD